MRKFPPSWATVVRNVEHDRNLFVSLVCVLLGFGVLMVHSASVTSWPTEFEQVYLSKHLFFLAIGIVAAAVCSWLPPRFWYSAAPFLFAATVLLLVAVLMPGIGTEVNGAQRWFRFGSASLQPSEIAKVTLPLILAAIMTRWRAKLGHWFWGTLPVVVPIAVVLPLILVQPDLGTTLFLVMGSATALLVGGWPIRNFMVSICLVIPALGGLVAMKPYQVKRITGFLATWSDLNDAPYQLKQSLVTLGAGGTSGVGLGKGWQKLSFLPEANTDFVFAVVGEELGLLGTLGLVALWCGLYLVGLRLYRFHDRGSFSYIVGVTLLTQLALQAVLNMAVVTALVPPKGIPHPLISYGGSSLVFSLISLGLIVGLARAEDTLAGHAEHAGA